MRSSLRAAVATAAFSVLCIPQLAAADISFGTDGDIINNSPNLGYGTGANDRACSTRGTAVTGEVFLKYNGSANDHFTAGEAIDVVVYSAPAGVTVTADPVNVSNPWTGSSADVPITLHTTVSPTSPGGSVRLTITGRDSHEEAGAGGEGGKPGFQVLIDCGSAPADSTKPTISLSHGTPTGNAPWFITDPVTVTITASDNVGVTSINCTDAVDGGSPAAITVNADSTLTVTGDGVHALSCTASDAAGNTATGTDTVYIDTAEPQISGPTRSPVNPAGTDNFLVDWFKTDVVYTWTCSDATSGPVSATDVQTLSAENVDRDTGSVATGTCTDNAGNTSTDDSDETNIDKTAPSLGITGPVDGANIDICTATSPTFNPTDALSGVATSSSSWTPPAVLGLGAFVYSASASDYATNSSSETRTYHGVYGSAYSGILQPINIDGRSRFKLGSTIPVKFKLSCNGVPVTNAQATLRLTQGDVTADPGENEAVSTSAATTGNLFRYDATGQQYIFNLNTKAPYTNPGGGSVAFSQGTWTLYINLGDGSAPRTQVIQIAK